MRYHRSGPWDDSWPLLTLNLYADDLAAFIESFDVGPAHLVGWSMGASVARTTSLKYPDLVRNAYLYEGVADVNKSPAAAQEEKESSYKLLNPVLTAYEGADSLCSVRALIDGVGGKVGGRLSFDRVFSNRRA